MALCWIVAMASANAEMPQSFIGTLHYEVAYEDITTPLRYYSDGTHVRIELGSEGTPYRVWLRGLEGVDGVAVLSPFKMSYVIESDRPERPRGSRESPPAAEKEQSERREGVQTELEGLACLQMELPTDGPNTELWILENALPFPSGVLRSWSGLREPERDIARCCRDHKGVPLQIERRNWLGRSVFSIQLKNVLTNVPPPALFVLPENYDQVGSVSVGGPGGQGGRRSPPSGDRGPPSGGGGLPGR